LRLYFIIYFIVKIIIDVAFGSNITNSDLNYLKLSPVVFLVFAVIINLILFLIGLLLFHFLLEERNWTRIVLLIIGWLAVIDVISSLVFSSNVTKILTHIFYGNMNWSRVILSDRITNLLGLFFWSYADDILQFKNDVKMIFLPERV